MYKVIKYRYIDIDEREILYSHEARTLEEAKILKEMFLKENNEYYEDYDKYKYEVIILYSEDDKKWRKL